MFNFNKFNALIEETGVSKSHIARKLVDKEEKAKYFFRDKEDPKKKTKPLTDEQIEIIASCLWTTSAYLTDQTDVKERPVPEDGNGLFAKVSLLSPAFQEKFLRFLELAAANPDTAERFLDFAVKELENLR